MPPTPCAAALTPEMIRAASRVSEAHRRFVEHATNDPVCLDRARFGALHEAHCAISDPVQAWPTLLGGATRAELERVSVGLCRLIKQVPGLIFDYDTEAISAYYHLQLDFVRHFVLPAATAPAIAGAFGRGDFVMTAERLWCVEFNIAANVGGIWEAPAWQQRMAAVPVITEYLRGHAVSGTSRNSLRAMLQHVHAHATQYARETQDGVNVAYAITKGSLDEDEAMRSLGEYFAEEYAAAMREMDAPASGTFTLCGFDALTPQGDTLTLNGHPVHALLEFTAGDVPLHILRCHQRGAFTLHNGPATYILCNKLNLALLSEYGETGLFDDEARALIHDHIPWTRKVADAPATFDGADVRLPEFIRENAGRLVLKKGISRSGHDVVPGPGTSAEVWEQALRHALYEQDWIVQQYVPCPLLPYQHGDYGWLPHRAVWGAFVFGDRYGGAFLRLLPDAQGAVVATSKGAADGLVLEVP
jgi:hypothetical protein